jgi:toxin-antitoxin system PIN domain toxin
MIIPDVNLLLYATIEDYDEYAQARPWLLEIMNGDKPVGLTDIVLFGYLRIGTNPKVFRSTLPQPQAALNQIGAWLAQPHVQYLTSSPAHRDTAFRLMSEQGLRGAVITDVQLAAHAIENDATLHSHDSDFARIPGLRWHDPLVKKPRPRR